MTANQNILLVEDEDDIAVLLGMRLEAEGYSVTRVANADEALERAAELRPGLMILDLMLPGEGGLGVLWKLRKTSPVPDTPVIVLTGMQDEEYEGQVKELEVAAYLQKPYDPAELLREVELVLGKPE